MKLALAQVCRRLFRILFLVAAARVLQVSSFGGYAVLLTIMEMMAVFSGSAFTDFITREGARDPDRAGALAAIIARLRITYLIPLLFIELLVMRCLHFDDWILVAALLSSTLFGRSVIEATQGALRAYERLNPFLAIEFIQGSTLIGVGLLLMRRSPTLVSVALSEVIASAAASSFALMLLLQMRNPFDFKPSLKVLARQILPFNIYPLIGNFYDRADLLLLAKLVGDVAAGIYAVPYRVFAGFQIIPYGLLGALLPKFSRKYDFSSRHFQKVLGFLYIVAALIVGETMLFARPIISLVLGQKYSASAVVIEILIWALFPMFFNYALNTYILSDNGEHIFVYTATICTLCNVVANWILIPRFSYTAAAVVTIFTELVLLAVNWRIVRQRLGFLPMPMHFYAFTAVFAAVVLGIIFLSIPRAVLGLMIPACFAFALWLLLRRTHSEVAAIPA